jgi:hypothetical protein
MRDLNLVKLLTGIALRIWATTGGLLLASLLLYCFYGGTVGFLVFLIAISGN